MNSALKARLKQAGKNTKLGRALVKKTRILRRKQEFITKRLKRNLKKA